MSINIVAQWKYPNANKIKNDVVITYDVVYHKELSEKQKKYPGLKKEVIVIFNKDKLIEKSFSNSFKYQMFSLFDYQKEVFYSCMISGKKKTGVSQKFGNPKKPLFLKIGETKNIIGIPCQVYTTKVKGKTVEVLTTKKFGLRFVKHFNAQGFILKYTANDKYLGEYTVTAKKITYTKLPESVYSLEGFTIKTKEEQKEYVSNRKERINKNKEDNIEKIGELAPNFSVRSMQGNKFKTKSLKGKIVVLNFWFTTCSPCKNEIPQLNQLKKQFQDKDVEFVAIALDQEYKIDKFLQKTPFKYDIIEDGRWIAERFGIQLYPTNIIIDKQGRYQFIKTGYKKDITKAMTYKIEKLLAQE